MKDVSKKERRKMFLLMSLVVTIWGMDYVFAKQALDTLQPMSLLFFKYGTGIFLVAAIKFKTDGKKFIRKKDIPKLIACSISGEILYYFCEYSAMEYIHVSAITIILAFVPVVSMVIERIVFKKKPTAKMVVGAFACIIGVCLVIGADYGALLDGKLLGYLLAFGAVFAWNVYNFLTESLHGEYNAATLTFSQLLCTLIIISPYAINNMPPIETYTPEFIGGILYLGLASAGFGFMTQVRAIHVLGPTTAGLFSNFLPITATFFGWVFLQQSISIVQVIGGIIVISSGCIVIKEKGKLEEKLNENYELDHVD